MITIRMDDAKAQAALKRFADAVGKDAGPLIADEARLLAVDLMKMQMPKGLTKAAQAKGQKSVSIDVRKAAPTFKTNTLRHLVDKANETGNIGPMNATLSHMGRQSRVVHFTPDVHRSARNESGQVKRKMVQNQMATRADIDAREAHIKAKQRNVGMMKGPWAYAVEVLNRHGLSKSRIQAWIKSNMMKGASWLATRVKVNMRGAKTSAQISTSTTANMNVVIRTAMQKRVSALNRKAKNLLAGKAAIIDGKFKILRNDRK